MSLKIEAAFYTGAQLDNQYQCDLFAFVTPKATTIQLPDPTVTVNVGGAIETNQVDALNGFYVGTIFTRGSSTADDWVNHELHEKFRFRRKVSRNDLLVLSVSMLRTLGGAGAPPTQTGAMYVVIEV